jgi:hypothetical protein
MGPALSKQIDSDPARLAEKGQDVCHFIVFIRLWEALCRQKGQSAAAQLAANVVSFG